MRLLDARTLKIIEFKGDNVPPYAILSHTWGKHEISFRGMRSRRREKKKGFVKIKGCCERCIEDGLDYVWVDTCCIDKTSSAELSEALNSMFWWYAQAKICYAYLSDVYLDRDDLPELFHGSRWFTRGWTLQELLAPPEVYFFTAEWKLFGDRTGYAVDISQITGIHEDALSGNVDVIRGFSIAQKMSWAAQRATEKPEDVAYCLLGIFNVNMPLLYGEGQKAFIRLQEEIMKDSDDQSLFAWQGSVLEIHRSSAAGYQHFTITTTDPNQELEVPPSDEFLSLLAPSPANFKLCSGITSFRDWKVSEPYSMTNAGLRIKGPLYQLDTSFPRFADHLFFLQCYDKDAPIHWLGIFLAKLAPEGDQFARKSTGICRHSGLLFEQTKTRTIFIRKEIVKPELEHALEIGRRVSFDLNFRPTQGYDFNVTGAWPSDQLSEGFRIRAPSWVNTSISPQNWSWSAAVEVELVCTNNEASEAFVLLVGNDGTRNRCWGTLQLSPESGKTGDIEAIKSVLRGVTESGEGLDFCSQQMKIWRSNYEWCISIGVFDSTDNEIPGESFFAHWDGSPLKVVLDVTACNYLPNGPELPNKHNVISNIFTETKFSRRRNTRHGV